MSRKYEPLTGRLAALAVAGREVVEFDFAEISELVDGLPSTAYGTRQWWANSASSQGRSWCDADWHVARVDFVRRRVRFERGPVGAAPRRAGATRQEVVLDVETDAATLDVRVRLTWLRGGRVRLDDNRRLHDEARAHLARGGAVAVAVATSATIDPRARPSRCR